jgi:hypothetical protein
MLKHDQENNKSEEHSSFFLQLVNKHLPSDDAHKEERSIGTKEFILWMVGVIAGLFILRIVFSLLFQYF